jgi:16S rRNA (uracil1498-N3)-methyltransferase
MYRFFIEPELCHGETISITGEDYNHIKNVLRLKCGEQITISNGADREYICEIVDYTDSEVIAKIVDILGSHAELSTEITLYQGYPKADKMELIIQKAVELGAVRIVPVMTRRSVVKLDEKKANKKVERFNAIALSAAKQSKRGVIPVVEPVMSYKEALEDAKKLEMKLIPYEDAKGIAHSREVIQEARGKQSIGIFIGPEGGFEEQEVEAAMAIGAESITLGRRILRTETAGMAVLSILMFALEDDEEM